MTTPPTLLTARQVAERLGVKVARVNQLAAHYRLGWQPYEGVRAPRLFSEADVAVMAARPKWGEHRRKDALHSP